MFPQLDVTEATYLARLIVSILGVVVFFSLAVWLIRRRQTAQPIEAEPVPPKFEMTPGAETLLANLNALTSHEQSERHLALVQAYETWKTERVLHSEDGRSRFVRTGVEKSGLRYQLVATTQTQALAILVSFLMAEHDPQASVQAEAFFAAALAHPAYQQPDLSSWKFLPDLPRSARLDPDIHAEAWLIHSMTMATKRWSGINRFNYSEIIPERLRALQTYAKTLAPEMLAQISFSGYLTSRLRILDASLDWANLGESQEQFFANFAEPGYLKGEPVFSKLGLSLLQLGFLAFLNHDPLALNAIRGSEQEFVEFVEGLLINQLTGPEFSRLAMLSSIVPALLALELRELSERVWDALIDSQPEKDDGLGATLRLLGMALLSGTAI